MHTEAKIKSWLKAIVSPQRFLHCMGVHETVTALAAGYGQEVEPLQIAALVHDCARELPDEELLAAAQAWGLATRPVDRECPVLLHGRLGVEMARRDLGIDDPVVSSAVIYHTAGHRRMSLSDKLFFLSDHTEPLRSYQGVEELRTVTAQDIDAAVLLAIEINMEHLRAAGKTIDPLTLELHELLLGGG